MDTEWLIVAATPLAFVAFLAFLAVFFWAFLAARFAIDKSRKRRRVKHRNAHAVTAPEDAPGGPPAWWGPRAAAGFGDVLDDVTGAPVVDWSLPLIIGDVCPDRTGAASPRPVDDLPETTGMLRAINGVEVVRGAVPLTARWYSEVQR